MRKRLHGIVFGCGFVSFVVGIGLWSLAAAFVAAGMVLMGLVVWPVLSVRRG